MWYIQSNLIFYGLTISFHRSKEVFVCCLIVSLRCVFWVAPSIRGGGIDSPRPASQRAAAFVLTAALLTGAAFPAFAGTYYIEEGDITISAGTVAGTNKVEQGGTLKSENDKDTVITNQKTDTASSNTVTIDAGKDKVEVTLKDVNIDASSRKEAAMSVTGSGNTTIKLDGDNHLTGGNGSSGIGSSGIDSIGSLTIYGGENDSLTAKGGSGADGYGGDGIRSGGVVTISGNTVNAAGATAAKSAATASAASTVSPSPAVRSKPLAVTAAPAATASPAAAASPSPTVRSLPPEAIARAVMAPAATASAATAASPSPAIRSTPLAATAAKSAATASAATAASPFPAVRSKLLAASAKTAPAAAASTAAASICRAASS